MEDLNNSISAILEKELSSAAWSWLNDMASLVSNETTSKALNTTFAKIPSVTGKAAIVLENKEVESQQRQYPVLVIDHWTVDRLARCWIIMQLNPGDKQTYVQKIENLFSAAEMNELVALYSSLPVLSFPDLWKWRCTEGIRSNIGSVLEAIMYENSYPYHHLEEAAWNQMVLKAFFTDKQVDRIVGLDERANARLASVLIDYANERWAARRQVNIQLWRLVAKFINAENFQAIQKLYNSDNIAEKKAALLACTASEFSSCKSLLNDAPSWASEIKENRFSWEKLIKEVSKN